MHLVDKYIHFIHTSLNKSIIFDELHLNENATIIKSWRIKKTIQPKTIQDKTQNVGRAGNYKSWICFFILGPSSYIAPINSPFNAATFSRFPFAL